jgi:hypothetical protein
VAPKNASTGTPDRYCALCPPAPKHATDGPQKRGYSRLGVAIGRSVKTPRKSRVAPYASISHQKPAAISVPFLSGSERITIADLLHAPHSIRAIALELGLLGSLKCSKRVLLKSTRVGWA